jgi:hypothetical protein
MIVIVVKKLRGSVLVGLPPKRPCQDFLALIDAQWDIIPALTFSYKIIQRSFICKPVKLLRALGAGFAGL